MSRRLISVGLIAACAVVVAIEVARLSHARSREVFNRTAGSLLRDHEHVGLAGATWLVAAFLGVVLILPRSVAIAAMWAVAVGDATAAIVGRSFGRHHLWHSAKSLEGSAACFVATLAGALWLAGLPRIEALLSAAIATASEWPDRPFDDNLRIATSVGGGILLWRMAFS